MITIKKAGGRVKDINIFFSAKCNMNCAYCYIPKTKYLNKVNEKVRESLINGSIVKNIKSFVDPEDMSTVSLWGAEPTLNSDCAEKFFSDLFKEFPMIDTVEFSTNTLLGCEYILEIVDAVDKCSYKLKNPENIGVDIQISLDGPAWITDANRHPNATAKIIKVYKSLVDEFSVRKYGNLKKVNIHFKPTLTCENMREMNNDLNKLVGWYKFFEELVDYRRKCKKKHGVLGYIPAPLPTIVTPGKHTSEDGKQLAQWIRNTKGVDTSQFKYYKQPLFTQPLTKVKHFIEINQEVAGRFHELTCGGADASFALGVQNDIHPCHRNFICNSYLEYPSAKERLASRNLVVEVGDDTNLLRLLYITRGYHDFFSARAAFITAAVKRLAMCGQADEIYLYNDDLCMLLGVALSGITCYIGSVVESTSVHLPMLSLIRLLANGAFQELLEMLLERWGNGHGLSLGK